MSGKQDRLLSHLKSCQKVDAQTRDRALADFAAYKENLPPTRGQSRIPYSPALANNSHRFPLQPIPTPPSSSATTRPLKRAKTSLEDIADSGALWPSGRQDEFDRDMCKLFVSCGFAWNAASNPEMSLFVSKWIPGATVPDRRSLSGRVLDGEVAKVEARTKERIAGKMATGQCDGWKNVAKTSIVTSMITVEHEVCLDV
jgi:hypothetical protein